MENNSDYAAELLKLNEVFKDVEDSKKKLIDGLIQDAAFLYSENRKLRKNMGATGMVKTHPNNPDLQKTTESAKQYLKNVNSYSVAIKTLNSILSKDIPEGDDEFDTWIKSRREADDK